jgi:DNA-binding transcriptional LysR family regulator
MADVSLAGLRVVREVARRGSFSAAAEALDYTQSAVSRQVAVAERATGCALFERHARGVTLTPAGAIVVHHATAALAELQAARNAIEDLASRRPRRVHLGAISTAMAALVPRALAALGAREPRLGVTLHEGVSDRLSRRALSGRLDLAIVTAAPDRPEGLVDEELLDDSLLVAMARDHRLADRGAVDPDELREELWIAGSSDPRSPLLGAWTSARWRPRIAHEVRDWTAKLGLVAAGRGITLVSGLALGMLPSDVVAAKIDDPSARRRLALVRRAGTDEDARLASVAETLRDVAIDLQRA